jgi:hypothetical protein
MEMRRAFYCVLILLAIAGLADSASAKTPALAYATSGSCLNSPDGFNSKLEPVNSGIAWTITFNAVGSADANGNVTEVGQSVDTASFGVGPRMHSPAANAYKGTFTSTVSGPNDDGSSTFHVRMLSGTFTAGPKAGLSFKISSFELKGWSGNNGISVYGSGESPVIQTFSLSNGTSFQRICTVRTVVTSPPQ